MGNLLKIKTTSPKKATEGFTPHQFQRFVKLKESAIRRTRLTANFPQKRKTVLRIGAGFTLIEVLISVTVGVMILIIVYASFIAGQKLYHRGILNAELSQNGRIALDRMSRELRQTGQLTTVLSPTPLDPPQTEIAFEDGHIDTIQYIRYYLSGTDLKRDQGHYYFPSDPSSWVYYNAVDGGGNPAQYTIDSQQTIAQNISYINFYGEKTISIDLTLEKESRQIQFRTKNTGRNL